MVTSSSNRGSSSESKSGEDTDTIASPSPTPTHRTAAVVKHVLASEDKCTWHQNQMRCGLPRSCYDCLNVRIATEEKCTITPSGYCASIDKYDPSLDYRRNASGADNYFPSTNTTYCEYGDQTCSQCRATVFRESIDGSDNPSQFCVGYRGCVCVGFCESSVWKPVVVDMLCEQASSNTIGPYRTALTGPLRTIAFIVVLIITIPVVLVVGNSMRLRASRRRARQRAREARLDARAPPLALNGWKALREELIENEHQSFARHDASTAAPASPTASQADSSDGAVGVRAERGDASGVDEATPSTTTALPRLQLLS